MSVNKKYPQKIYGYKWRIHDDESLRNVDLVSTTVDNFDEYDEVLVGYPVWWGIAAWPVN